MSFFSSSSSPQTYKPQVRQEGFHLPSPPPSVPSPSSLSDPNNMFSHFLPDPLYKPGGPNGNGNNSGSNTNGGGNHHQDPFADDLSSLLPHPSPAPHSATSHERSTHSPDDPHHQNHHSQHQHHQDHSQYRHNIFDISAPSFSSHPPPPPPSHSSAGGGGYPASPTYDYAPSAPPPHFNSTVPAIGSSLRYDDQHQHQQPTPSSYDYAPPPPPSSSAAALRSRSRSRDLGSGTTTNGGPARTQRAKRGSISSASPPRHPHAILIPPLSSRNGNANGNSNNPVSPLSLHSLSTSTPGPGGWFPSHDAYGSLPTPDSLGGPAFGSYPPIGVSPKDSLSGDTLLSPTSNVGSVGTAGGGGGTMDAAAKQAALANEKRRRRRESHNAVERRRRDNINEKIAELATLIPESMLEPGGSAASPADDPCSVLVAPTPPKDGDEDTPNGNTSSSNNNKKDNSSDKERERDGGVKANKGMILRKSVEYIRYLQQLVSAQAARNRALEEQLARSGGIVLGLPPSEHEPEMVVIGEDAETVFGTATTVTATGSDGRRSLERVVEHADEDVLLNGSNTDHDGDADGMLGVEDGDADMAMSAKAASIVGEGDSEAGESEGDERRVGAGRGRRARRGPDEADEDMEVS